MGTVFTENKRLSDWLKGELGEPKDFCRESGIALAGETLRTGMVVGKLTGGGLELVQLDPSASVGAGSDTVAGIMISDVDGDTTGDVPCVYLARGPATVSDNGLIWPDVISGGEKTAALAALKTLGIIVRTGA